MALLSIRQRGQFFLSGGAAARSCVPKVLPWPGEGSGACPDGQLFKTKHIAPYWACQAIVQAESQVQNVSQPERDCFSWEERFPRETISLRLRHILDLGLSLHNSLTGPVRSYV